MNPDQTAPLGAVWSGFIVFAFIIKSSLFVCLFVWFDSLRPINNLSGIKGRVFLGRTSTKLGLMFLLKDQHSDAGETQTRGPSVSRQALYHWATALPKVV